MTQHNKPRYGLPRGAGSIQRRAASWWMIYRDAEGKLVQRNARTTDERAALVALCQEAIKTARARVAQIQAVRDEAAQGGGAAAARGRGPAQAGRKHRGLAGSGRENPARIPARQGTQAAGKGK